MHVSKRTSHEVFFTFLIVILNHVLIMMVLFLLNLQLSNALACLQLRASSALDSLYVLVFLMKAHCTLDPYLLNPGN